MCTPCSFGSDGPLGPLVPVLSWQTHQVQMEIYRWRQGIFCIWSAWPLYTRVEFPGGCFCLTQSGLSIKCFVLLFEDQVPSAPSKNFGHERNWHQTQRFYDGTHTAWRTFCESALRFFCKESFVRDVDPTHTEALKWSRSIDSGLPCYHSTIYERTHVSFFNNGHVRQHVHQFSTSSACVLPPLYERNVDHNGHTGGSRFIRTRLNQNGLCVSEIFSKPHLFVVLFCMQIKILDKPNFYHFVLFSDKAWPTCTDGMPSLITCFLNSFPKSPGRLCARNTAGVLSSCTFGEGPAAEWNPKICGWFAWVAVLNHASRELPFFSCFFLSNKTIYNAVDSRHLRKTKWRVLIFSSASNRLMSGKANSAMSLPGRWPDQSWLKHWTSLCCDRFNDSHFSEEISRIMRLQRLKVFWLRSRK